jgi:lipopolysaccharide/colanic/teichoic acid biosynthesis glycosyltransferase
MDAMETPGSATKISKSKELKEIKQSQKTSGKYMSFNDSDERKSDVLFSLLTRQIGTEPVEFISKHIALTSGSTFLTKTSIKFNIDKIPRGQYQNIVNLKRINTIRRINKFFNAVSNKIPKGGLYVGIVETYSTRKARLLRKFWFPFNWIYYTFDVIFTRVLPKVPITKNIYFYITKGKNRVLSMAESYGRLYSCGFEMVEARDIGDVQYFIFRKFREPHYDSNPTYGPFITLNRYGKGGKLFKVYKLRTMHAYSEYLQEYVYQQNSLAEGGKLKNDFRITTEGRFFRKFWLDELPMLINLLKGEMKVIGVRPLSRHYFSLYSEELRQKRIKFKPGLIPPFYADLPKTLEEIMESEMRYLEAYEKHPWKTDIIYFFKAMTNIFIKKARST